MGDGQGKKDVSDRIDDEEQILGLRDDKPPEPKDRDDNNDEPVDDKTGKEMENEFDGDMHDIAPEDREDGAENEEPEKPDLDREMGAVDNDQQEVIDERLWNEEDDKDSDQKNKQVVTDLGSSRYCLGGK